MSGVWAAGLFGSVIALALIVVALMDASSRKAAREDNGKR
jgi:hypothetical protein